MKLNTFLRAGEPDTKGRRRAPSVYIPTIYFAEGLPYVLVNSVSVIMYVKYGLSNIQIGLYTSLLAWPWVLKMFWGPVVDRYSTKRTWLLIMQSLCTVLFALTAAALSLDAFFTLTLIIFATIAFISATHDIAIDGFYMLSLTKKQQARFIGIRSLFYRAAIIFGTGILVFIVGKIENRYSVELSWISAFLICTVIFAAISLFHFWYLPYPDSDEKKTAYKDRSNPSYSSFLQYFIDVFKTFFTQKKIIPIIAFILLYRFGEAQLTKMVPPFLLNSLEQGGMGIATDEYGIIQGIVGSLSLIIGGIVGGLVIARFGLRKCLFPMALALNLPNILYVYVAYARPALSFIAAAIAVEQFGYGLGFSAFMMFLISISKGENKTSLYAIATGIMALGMMIPGMMSGFIQEWLGYQNFFIVATLLAIPGMITIFFIPLEDNSG